MCTLLLALTVGELYIEALVLALDPPPLLDPPYLLEPALLGSALLAVDLLLALELLGSPVINYNTSGSSSVHVFTYLIIEQCLIDLAGQQYLHCVVIKEKTFYQEIIV